MHARLSKKKSLKFHVLNFNSIKNFLNKHKKITQ